MTNKYMIMQSSDDQIISIITADINAWVPVVGEYVYPYNSQSIGDTFDINHHHYAVLVDSTTGAFAQASLIDIIPDGLTEVSSLPSDNAQYWDFIGMVWYWPKPVLKTRASTIRNVKEIGGISVTIGANTIPVNTDSISVTDLVVYANECVNEVATNTRQYIKPDSTSITLTAGDIMTIFYTVADHIQRCSDAEKDVTDAIDATTATDPTGCQTVFDTRYSYYVSNPISRPQKTITSASISDFATAVNSILTSGGFLANPAITKQSGTITRATTDSSGTQDVATTFQPKLIIFSAVDNTDSSVTSDGWDDGSKVASTYTSSQNVLTNLLGGILAAAITNKNHTNSINLIGGGNGHTAKVTTLNSSKFTLTWAKVGSGRNITVNYIAIK